MILAVAATEIEMTPFVAELLAAGHSCRTLVTGVGPVESAFRLTRFLCENSKQFEAVVQFGVGGAYLQPELSVQPKLLDICLAEQEVFGDLGICLGESMAYLESSLTGNISSEMDKKILQHGKSILARLGITCFTGVFITVSGITATRARGKMLQSRWNGLCENMEGAAIARVCRDFDLPCLELRCFSNYVEDRDTSNWRLQEACKKAAHTAIQLIEGITQ